MKQNNTGLTTDIHIRVSEEEYGLIQGEAAKIGGSVSQAARNILFRKAPSFSADLSAKEEKHRSLLALQSIRNDFKKLAGSYLGFVETYKKNSGLLNRNGEPAMDQYNTIRMIRALESVTLELQQSLNTVLHSKGLKEEHAVARDGDIKKAEEKAREETIKSYYYMEKIEIIGKLAEDASVYKSKSGKDKLLLRVSVACEGPSKKNREWLVFYGKTEIADLLKKGKAVFVSGDFALNDKNECVVYPEKLKFLGD